MASRLTCCCNGPQVDKSAKKYKLDEQGNIINPDTDDVEPAEPAASPFAAAFGGGAPAAAGGGFSFGGAPAAGGGGFAFGGSAAPAAGGGGFVFGGAPAPAAGGGGGAGFVFGGAAAPAAVGAAKKRPAKELAATRAKRSRTNALRLTGEESGIVLISGNGDCGQLGLGSGDDDVRDAMSPVRMPALDLMRVCQVRMGTDH